MAIRKSKHISNYTVIPNKIFNSGLSIEAIGLLSYFLSLPHDWVIYKTTLHASLNVGRDKLDKIFKELTDNKYIKSTKSNNNGKITYEHIVYDKPYTEMPLTEKPSTVKPYTEKPSTVKPHLQSTNKLSNNKPSTNKENKHKTLYQLAVDFWLEFKVDYIFDGMSGKHLKKLLDKIKGLLHKNGSDESDESIIQLFIAMCNNLPTWYQDKDLSVINSKFNEIIEQIKNKKNETSNNKKQSKFNGI